jgi:hypothetical protein
VRHLALTLVVCLLTSMPVLARSIVTGRAGERWAAGQVIIQLDSCLRGCIDPARQDGVLTVGIPELDELCRRWAVTGFEPLLRHANPGRAARESGADMLFLLSFDREASVEAVVADFARNPLVERAVPNALLPLLGSGLDVPDDSLYPNEWHLPRMRATQAWEVAHGDSSTVIASLDDGAKWTHPDIEANVWVNRLEDINGNGRFDTLPAPEGDIDGIDQDSNGYVDDVIGYDFLDGDPNPVSGPGDDHGTVCFGAADAVTNNRRGVAAPPWNARGMVLRCGGSGYISLAAAIAATYYAVQNGAWVIAMSFGGSSPYPPHRQACLDAWNSGVALVASAGSTNDRVYPACYEGVIAVSGSDQQDRVFGSSADWVDVCAPARSIWSTSGESGYGSFDGTSLSCHLAAGVLAWYKCQDPALTNAAAEETLYARCDSMPGGTVGHGRISMVREQSGMEEGSSTTNTRRTPLEVSLVRGVLRIGDSRQNTGYRAELLDITGRKVMDLAPGANNLRRLPPGVYFVRRASGVERETSGVTKVVVQR